MDNKIIKRFNKEKTIQDKKYFCENVVKTIRRLEEGLEELGEKNK